MDVLNILPYGGIATMILLLVTFEVKYRQGGNTPTGNGYTYYTPNNDIVRVCHKFGSRYKIYVKDSCPVPVKHDRFGDYFILNARSAADVEYQIDDLYSI